MTLTPPISGGPYIFIIPSDNLGNSILGQQSSANSIPVVIAADQPGSPNFNSFVTNGITNPVPVMNVQSGIITPIEQSATIAGAAAGTCTLTGVAGKFTYLRGFTVTSVPAAAVVSGLITVTGLTNTLNYYYSMLVTGESTLSVIFGDPGIQSSAVATSIVVNFPAVVGGSNTAISMHGYVL